MVTEKETAEPSIGIVTSMIPNCVKCPNATRIDSARNGMVIRRPLAVNSEFLYALID